ncbi:MAG: transglutaminase domain-containing protein [Polaribacter sp.]|uniref:transglutaminase domain-containing protein n=1 Tax=Polaribacter sp. TaxID=1920175 RepID=UPI002F34F5BA
MKQLLFFFLLISISIQSQDFSNVDNLVTDYPRFSNAQDLASKISTDFISDEEKARAAFFWLAKNIRYNLEEYYNPTQRSYNLSYATEEEKLQKLQAIKDKVVSDAFKNKTGVCEEYAQSFKKICDLLGLESEVIKGNVRNLPQEIGKPVNTSNHAWNAIKLNNKWIILDATWAAGYEYNGRWIRKFDPYFYNIPKEKIFKTHFPEDTLWVLRFGRISLQEFYNQPIYGHSFLSSKATLISPKKGIIRINASKKIELKFKHLAPNTLIYYTFKGMKFAQNPIITLENEITTLTINDVSRNSEFVLYINNEAALQFKTK